MRFYSTLPDTFANNFKMNVGLLPSDAIIADRAFNTAAVADATLGCALRCGHLAAVTQSSPYGCCEARIRHISMDSRPQPCLSSDSELTTAVHSGRYKAVESSAYDTRAPERQTIAMTRLNAAGQRLCGEAVEITLSNLRSGDPTATSGSGSNQFCTSELYRQVLAPALPYS